ncbi:MAG: hypothetical protein QXU79_00185 [Candidatus Micrarchaeaceae archaeon]
MEILHRYSVEQAERDGVLVPVMDPRVSHVTRGVWTKYVKSLLGGAIVDVTRLAAVLRAVRRDTLGGQDFVEVKLADGTKVWAVRNETGKYTVMFPEEY